MKKISPTLVEGVLLLAGAIRFPGEPLGMALLFMGVLVVFLETPAKRKRLQH